MSTTNTMGIPKLLPITASFALPLALFNTYLQWNCVQARIANSVLLGRDSSTSTSTAPGARDTVTVSGADGSPTIDDPVLVATTVHDNFVQNAPLALIFAAGVELNGGDRHALAYTLAFFTAARVAHAVGVNGGRAMLRFRQLGFFGTVGTLLGLSGWCFSLVKGYWGL